MDYVRLSARCTGGMQTADGDPLTFADGHTASDVVIGNPACAEQRMPDCSAQWVVTRRLISSSDFVLARANMSRMRAFCGVRLSAVR